MLGYSRELGDRGLHWKVGGRFVVSRMSLPESHVSRTVQQVHEHIQLGVQRNSGNCDYRKAMAVARK
jgi:hypothetical protein